MPQKQLTYQDVAIDPDFLALPTAERIKVLDAIDEQFKGLPAAEKVKVAVRISTDPIDLPPVTAKQVLSPFIPTPREGVRMVGAGIGGTLGATAAGPAGAVGGGALGGAAGDAAFQLVERLRGSPDVAQSSAEAAYGVGAGAVQGAFQEGVGPAFAKGGRAVLNAMDRRAVGQVLRPSTEAVKEDIAAVAPQLAKQMPMALTSEGLLTKLRGNLNKAVTTLEKAYAAVPKNVRVKTEQARLALESERDALKIGGHLTPGTEGQFAAYEAVIDFLNKNRSVSIDDLRRNRQLWDQIVNYGRSAAAREPAVEAVYKSAADKLRGTINTVFPTIGKANEAVSLWTTAVGSLSRAENRTIGQRAMSVGNMVSGGVGSLVGTQAGIGPTAGAAVGVMIRELIQTPAWQTAGIAARQTAIKALQRGDVGAAINVLTGHAAGVATRKN